MNYIKVPAITANEDNIRLVKIIIKKNKVKEKDLICILESSKASYDFESPDNGFIYILHKVGDNLKIGETLAIISKEELSQDFIDKEKNKIKSIDSKRISKKAQKLMEDNNILEKDINKNGIINSEDVTAYMNKQSFNKKIVKSNSQAYLDLEKIMKSNYKKNVNLSEIQNLKNTLSAIQNIYQEKWNRFVPPIDIIFDRHENAKNYGFDETTDVSSLSYIIGDVKVGKNCFIGPYTVLDGSAGLTIGDNTSIAAGVHLYSHDSIARALSGKKLPQSYGKIKIGNNCFIGPNAVITKGVTVGNRCFVGSNAVLTFGIEDNTAVAGNPAIVIGEINENANGEITIEKKRKY
jgi:acetyltransferase-like isoleucine patch superfamily enzyme